MAGGITLDSNEVGPGYGRGYGYYGGDGGCYGNHGTALGGGFIGGLIAGGGAGYILSREVGDLKENMGTIRKEISDTACETEKAIAGVTYNLKDQLCDTEKLIGAESQVVQGNIQNLKDINNADHNSLRAEISALSRWQELAIRDVKDEVSDCCCATNTRLSEIECQIEKNRIENLNSYELLKRDTEIQRLKDIHWQEGQFCELKKGQLAIEALIRDERNIQQAKRQAIADFKQELIYTNLIGNNSGTGVSFNATGSAGTI